MKKLSLVALLLLLFVLQLSGCGKGDGDVGAVLGYEFPLVAGQKAVVFGDGLEIRFKKVLEDSRCPTGANCIWAGRVSVEVEFKDEEGSYTMVLVQTGLSEDYVEEDYKEYYLRYKVVPYPVVDSQIAKDDYRLLVTINKT